MKRLLLSSATEIKVLNFSNHRQAQPAGKPSLGWGWSRAVPGVGLMPVCVCVGSAAPLRALLCSDPMESCFRSGLCTAGAVLTHFVLLRGTVGGIWGSRQCWGLSQPWRVSSSAQSSPSLPLHLLLPLHHQCPTAPLGHLPVPPLGQGVGTPGSGAGTEQGNGKCCPVMAP